MIKIGECYQIFKLNLDFEGIWFLDCSWTSHKPSLYILFLPEEITSCQRNYILVKRNKFLSQELNSCLKKQILAKRNNCYSARRIFSLNFNQLATITNVRIITEISCDTMQISCKKCCHSDCPYLWKHTKSQIC